MTVEEAVREAYREAYLEEVRLFAELMNLPPGNPLIVDLLRYQIQEAVRRKDELRQVLFGVIEGERILRERLAVADASAAATAQ